MGKYEVGNLTCELGIRNRSMGWAVVKERNQNNTSNHLLFMGTLLLHNNYFVLNGLLLINKSRAMLCSKKKYCKWWFSNIICGSQSGIFQLKPQQQFLYYHYTFSVHIASDNVQTTILISVVWNLRSVVLKLRTYTGLRHQNLPKKIRWTKCNSSEVSMSNR